MKKTFVALLLLVVALGLAPMIGHADCVDTDLGSACESNGVITLDGAESNPDPLDGHASVDTNTGTVCASDGDTETCSQ